jgi:hypothetical protein
MDTKGWVLRAMRALRFAEYKQIQRWLDEEGEGLSKLELERALTDLVKEGHLELKADVYRLSNKRGASAAFDNLFKD